MRGRIVRSVGFRFHDAAANARDEQFRADQLAGDKGGVAVEKGGEMRDPAQLFLQLLMNRRRSLPWMFLASACFEQSSDFAVRCRLEDDLPVVEPAPVAALAAGLAAAGGEADVCATDGAAKATRVVKTRAVEALIIGDLPRASGSAGEKRARPRIVHAAEAAGSAVGTESATRRSVWVTRPWT